MIPRVGERTGGVPAGPGPSPGSEISYETYLNLIHQLDDLIAAFEHHPDPNTREQVVALLSGLDLLHHEALGRLVAMLRGSGAGEVLDRALQDPVTRTLLGLYGLADLDVPDEEEPKPVAPGFVPLERLTVNGKPPARWVEVARVEELPPGSTRAVEAGSGFPLLLLNVGGDVCGHRDACPVDGAPLGAAMLEEDELICGRHACRFDARTGRRRDAGEGRLQVVPVAVRGASIQVEERPRRSAAEPGPPDVGAP